MPVPEHSAVDVPTQFVESRGRRLAYRSLGKGAPLVLCHAFRAVMDAWDPAFLDALALHFNVITFDYSGVGLSTGAPSYKCEVMARDALDLVDALEMDRVVIGGWGRGGMVAQIFAVRYSEQVSHAILIGTVPPGPQPYPSEDMFLPTALKPNITPEDEYKLLFEPDSARSRAAADASRARIARRIASDRTPPIPQEILLEVLARMLQESHDPESWFPDPDGGYVAALASTSIPLLVISGDHDVAGPVENWYALNRRWKSLHILTIPQAGHGAHFQEPEFCADAIASFVRGVSHY